MQQDMPRIKTRFAPSPTGYLHVGGARTALYAWLFARRHGGQFLLRIEDTDTVRSTQPAIETILESMRWLGLNWDEGPYYQTQRFARYHEVLKQMLRDRTAYKCYCSKQRLDTLREQQRARGEKPRYDGYCRDKEPNMASDVAYVVRFRNPKDGSVHFDDSIRGQIVFKNSELDDLIICRSDQSPTYNFCVVVDDWDMEISHVIRGEDHITNTPRQINLLKALGAPIPQYAHLSMILGEDTHKMSKRHGAVSVLQYRDQGYLPQALLNYLSLLGWSHGDQQIFSLEDMQRYFALSDVNRSASCFDHEKLLWLNHYYMNHLPSEQVLPHLIWQLKYYKIENYQNLPLIELIKLLAPRHHRLDHLVLKNRYFLSDTIKINPEAAQKYLQSQAKQILTLSYDKFTELQEWAVEDIHQAILDISKLLNLSFGEIGMPLRVAVTGETSSPGIEKTLWLIGRQRVLNRINYILNNITMGK